MTMPNQELSDLKSRVLVAMRTGSNIARVPDHLISLIREAGSYLPERPESNTDLEYLYSVIVAIENKRKGQAEPSKEVQEAAPPSPPIEVAPPPVEVAPIEVAPEITAEEVELDTDSQWSEPVEESVSQHSEDAPKTKGGKSKKSKK